LSRNLAEEGIYPAIDVEASISRLMTHLVDKEQLKNAQKFKQLLSVYRQNKDLISMGAYSSGADPLIDEAIATRQQLVNFIRQGIGDAVNYPSAQSELINLALKTD
jgi:flagellum-specific ATP synthase